MAPTGQESVQTIALDDFCTQQGIDRIHLLKIDVEGAEYQVLKGAKMLLQAKRIDCIVFEFGVTSFDMGNTPEEIKTLLHSSGYGIRNVVSGDPIFPGGKQAKTARFSVHVAIPRF